jgi:hypothetical protein
METRHYTKDTHNSPILKCVKFDVRIVEWFRCSLNKVTENGNNLNPRQSENATRSLSFLFEDS